jgi:LPXTG-motif cell wall-anchored protein
VLKKLFAAIGVGSLIAIGGAVAANADTTVTLTADPSTVLVGQESTLTATGLQDGAIVIFSTPASITPVITPGEVTVVGGEAQATFTSSTAGAFEVVVINKYGGPVLASTTITVEDLPPITLMAEPATVGVGGSSTLTAGGIAEGVTVSFALPDFPNNMGYLAPESAVGGADGTATTTFTSDVPGTYEVIVLVPSGDEPRIASTTVTVVEIPPIVLTASPMTITLGQTSALTVTGMDDGLQALFGISVPVLPNNQGMLDPEAVTVVNGTASTTFRPNAAGTYVIDVATPYSEGPIASVTITVVPATAVLPATGGEASPIALWFGIGAVLLGAALITTRIVGRRSHQS